ncbi:SpoIIE family protein phosphatase [Spongiactinospora sp. TRM90649]|uniref:SpoIIE family protein phosphatase n=1 Tax=Spongiactinospora sp. TRM90649 TaxID=3031114 RepID=UPI0023F82970|nr:SpoIIE family protein phosphatase [Spongiactinospora sp. TRM90649]MDF5752050.1 SpoIIE family protein phosphatase [Spongiactinospora sp. TRM90649]
MQTHPGTGDPAGESGTPEGGHLGRLAATIDRLRREVQRAHLAADGRALIEMATGILVERLGCGPTQAAQQLTTLAEQAGVPVVHLAADLINQSSRDRVSEVARDFLAMAGGDAGDDEPVALRLRTAESGLLSAPDTQAVAESLLEHALTPLGATAVAVWLADTGAALTLAGYAGFGLEEARRWRYVPPGVATPARKALTERAVARIPSLREAGLPSIGHRQVGGGRVVAPAGTGGRIIGVLEICWPDEVGPLSPQIRRQVEALAELCAHTLDGPAGPPPGTPDLAQVVELADGLLDAAVVLTPHLDPEGRLADFRIHHANARFLDPAGRPRSSVTGSLMLEAYPMAAGDGGLFEKIERVHATGEAFRTDRMAVTALVDQVPLTTTAGVSVTRHGDGVLLIWRIEDEMARVASLLQHAQRLGRIGGFEENAVTGEIVWSRQIYDLYGLPAAAPPIPLEGLRDHAHPDDGAAIARFQRTLLHHRHPASVAFRVQRPEGVSRHIRVVAEPVFGEDSRLTAVRGVYQDISSQHWTEVALAATRDRLEHSEQQSAERNKLALQLQQAIMPPMRPPIDALGLRIAVRYRPAEKEHLVGGDWYDTVVLPSKQILLSVGDVAGHGIEAATGMVVLRNALRGLATTGAGPGQLLAWLNLVAHHLADNITATAVCALYDPDTRVLRWARAGHLPPVLVRDDEPEELPLIGGLLLGAVSEASYEEGDVQLHPGDTLLMFTDGLIERRDQALQHSQERFLAGTRAGAASLDELLDRLLAHSESDTDDDTCLIGVRLR